MKLPKRGLFSAVIVSVQVIVLAVILVVAHGASGVRADSLLDITGTVTDQNGNAVAGASVYATDPGGTAVDFGPVTTASDGTYDLQVSAGTYDFHYVPPSGSVLQPSVDSDVTTLNDQTINIQFTLPTYTFSGTVTDQNGNPLSGLGVQIGNTNSSNTTDQNGNFSEPVQAGSYPITFGGSSVSDNGSLAFTMGLATKNDQPVTENLTNGNAADNFILNFVNVNVTVRDGSGNLEQNAAVSVFSQGSSGGVSTIKAGNGTVYSYDQVSGRAVGSTDTNGFYATPFPQGAVFRAGDICAVLTDGNRICNTTPVTASSATNIELDEPVTHTLSGTITDQNGNPVSGLLVQATDSTNGVANSATTDQNGNYSITLEEGVYQMSYNGSDVSNNGGATTITMGLGTKNDTPISEDLTSGDVTDNYTLDFVNVGVTVKDGSGNPNENATVTINSPNGTTTITAGNGTAYTYDSLLARGTGSTDSNGQYSSLMPEGAVFPAGDICAVLTDGNRICNTTPVTASSATNIELDEPVTHTFSGTVLDQNGNPVSNVQVELDGTSNNSSITATTDQNGNFSTAVQAGVYQVSFNGTNVSDNRAVGMTYDLGVKNNPPVTEDLTNGDVTDNFTLDFVNLNVTVKDGSGNPLSNVPVTVFTQGSFGGNSPVTTGNGTVYPYDSMGMRATNTTDNNGLFATPVPEGAVFPAGTICAELSSEIQICNASPITATGNVSLVLQQSSQAQQTAPAITSATTASTGMRVPFSFTVTATGTPTPSLSESGTLPSGITFLDNGNGTATISGEAPTGSAGSYPITITAKNSVGNPAVQSFVLTINTSTSAPVITSVNSDNETTGIAFSFTVTTNGYPAPTLKKTDTLPSGVNFTANSNGTATISGTPKSSAAGTYTITITAKNSVGTSAQSFTLKISQMPVIKGLPATSTAQVGSRYNLTIKATGSVTPSLTESGALPNGLTFTSNSNGTATINGTPKAGSGGAYSITITATNQVGSTSQTMILKVDEAPQITSASSVTATRGTAFNFQITATGFPAPGYVLLGFLPSGLHFNSATGVISGTAKSTDPAGTYTFLVLAADSDGISRPQIFKLTLL